MAETTIPWAHYTHNHWIGCDEVGPECVNCYARELAKFHGWAHWGKHEPRYLTSEANRQKPYTWNRKAAKEGVRRRVFAQSLSDVFDIRVPDEWLGELLLTAGETAHLDWLLLTKRLETLLNGTLWVLPENVWLGASVGARRSKFRIDQLRETYARTRFLSVEPLLENLGELDLTGIDWVIVGGESGPKARRMELDWVRRIQTQCREQGVPFFFKQTGKILAKEFGLLNRKGEDLSELPPEFRVREFPKKSIYAAQIPATF